MKETNQKNKEQKKKKKKKREKPVTRPSSPSIDCRSFLVNISSFQCHKESSRRGRGENTAKPGNRRTIESRQGQGAWA